MTPGRPAELIRQAVIRDGHRCSICGRPCSEQEARRHSEPGAFGDSSMNFAAMCYACQTWLAHEGIKPAQYVVHVYDQNKPRQRLRIVVFDGMATLMIMLYSCYLAFSIFVIYNTPHNSLAMLGTGLLVFFLVIIGNSVISGFMDARRKANSFQSVRQSVDKPAIRLDDQR